MSGFPVPVLVTSRLLERDAPTAQPAAAPATPWPTMCRRRISRRRTRFAPLAIIPDRVMRPFAVPAQA